MSKSNDLKARIAVQLLNALVPENADWTTAVSEFSGKPVLEVYPADTGVCISGDPAAVLRYLEVIR